jgi:hypothetical protein
MNVIITSTTAAHDGGTIVVFRSPVGVGSARWNSTSYQACAGREYSIELDVDETALNCATVVATSATSSSLVEKNGEVTLTGIVDGIDDDGLFYFRLAPGCLIMISAIRDRPVKHGEWLTIRARAYDLVMTPFGA